MDLVTHANTIPWLVEPGFFVAMIAYLIDAVALLLVAGVVYALLHRLLAHGEDRHPAEEAGKQTQKVPFTHGLNFPMTINNRERSHHEA